MNKLLKKELRLTAAPITYFFLAFALMTLIPGYPILVGGFFITLGIFYTFQMARESNDILYTALLPCKSRMSFWPSTPSASSSSSWAGCSSSSPCLTAFFSAVFSARPMGWVSPLSCIASPGLRSSAWRKRCTISPAWRR